MATIDFDPFTEFSPEHIRTVMADLAADYRERIAYQDELLDHKLLMQRVSNRFRVPFGQTKKFYARLLRIVKEDIALYKELQRKDPSMREYFEGYLEMERKVKFMQKTFGPEAKKLYNIPAAKQYPMENMLQFNAAGFAKCIWHDEKTPSMKYNRERNSVHCFSCGRNADTIDVCQHLRGMSFGDAVRFLSNC